MQKDYEGNALIIYLDTQEDGSITVAFPVDLINSAPTDYNGFNYMVIADNEEVDFEEIDSGTVKIEFQTNTSTIEVIGGYW